VVIKDLKLHTNGEKTVDVTAVIFFSFIQTMVPTVVFTIQSQNICCYWTCMTVALLYVDFKFYYWFLFSFHIKKQIFVYKLHLCHIWSFAKFLHFQVLKCLWWVFIMASVLHAVMNLCYSVCPLHLISCLSVMLQYTWWFPVTLSKYGVKCQKNIQQNFEDDRCYSIITTASFIALFICWYNNRFPHCCGLLR
jgi:hypothetical protein